MTQLRNRLLGFGTLFLGLLAAGPAQAGSWQNNFTGFGATLKGDLYTPTTPASPPAVMVAVHMCTGHASTVHGWFDTYADANGFYIIAPDAGKQCFDSSAKRSGDPAAIVKMVDYLVTQKGADKTRVFVAGMSSGGCMTNTLLAVYPDVFAGGSAMPGFPAGGWPSGDTTCTKCGSSPSSTDGKYWGDMARSAFSWSGKYPCSQQWVGGGDEYNFDAYLPAVANQFVNLGGLGAGASATSGLSGWTRTVYKDTAGNIRVETNLGPNSQAHNLLPVGPNGIYKDVIRFVGLDKPGSICGMAGTTTGAGGAGGATGGGGAGGGAAGAAGNAGAAGKGGSPPTGSAGSTGGSNGVAGGPGGSSSSGTGGAAGANTGGAGSTGVAGSSTTGVAGSSSSGVAGSSSSGVAGSSSSGVAGSSSTGVAGSSSTGVAGSTGSGKGGSAGSDEGGTGICSASTGRYGMGALSLLLAAVLTATRRRRRAAK